MLECWLGFVMRWDSYPKDRMGQEGSAREETQSRDTSPSSDEKLPQLNQTVFFARPVPAFFAGGCGIAGGATGCPTIFVRAAAHCVKRVVVFGAPAVSLSIAPRNGEPS